MKRKIIICCVLVILFSFSFNICFADELEELSSSLELESVLNTLNEFNDEIDLDSMADSLIKGEGIDYGVIGNFIINNIFKEIKSGLKTGLSILIVLMLIAVIKSLELEKDSMIENAINIIGFLVITTMLLKNYSTNITLFTETINSLTKIVGVISPVLLAILIATGEAMTSGIISPLLLFLTSIIGVVVSYVIIPLLTLSLVLNIITNISNTVKLDKLGGFLKSSAMWIVSVVFALFLGVLGLETSVSTSVDSVTVKTTQAAVSNLVPVVGKFLSDSVEVVMGASEIIGKSIGVIGIVVLCIVLLIPLIKLIVISVMYKLLEAFSESMLADEKMTKLIGAFAKQYTSIVGITIGIGATFVIAIGIVVNVLGKVTGG